MFKFRTFCLFLFVFLFSSAVEAKICFLPGVLSGDGCLEETEIAACSGWSRTSPCPSGYQQDTCKKKNTTYYKCYCMGDNIKDLGVKYTCSRDYDSGCGCSKADTVCNRNLYKFTKNDCGKYAGSEPSANKCQNYSDLTWHYESCDCSETDYPYTCKEKGLKVNPVAPKCVNSKGETSYAFCACDDGWSTISCGQNTNGCTAELDSVNNGIDTCYSCGAESCPIATDKNLYTVYCTISSSINTNCTSLGYVSDADGKCDDGTVGLKCAFGRNYIYCGNSGGGNGGSSTPVPYDKTKTVVATFSGGGSTTVINSIGEMSRMWVDGVEVTVKETIELASGTHEVAMEGIYKIPANTFRDNTSLLAITIPGSVASIGSYAFSNCTNLESVTYLGTAEPDCSSSAFNRSTSFVGVKVPQGYTSDTFCRKSVVSQ